MFSGLAIDTPLCKHFVNTVSKLSWQGGADAFVSCNGETWCSDDHFPMCYDMHTIAYKIIVAGRHSKPIPGAHIHACIHTYIHTYNYAYNTYIATEIPAIQLTRWAPRSLAPITEPSFLGHKVTRSYYVCLPLGAC